MSDVPSTDSRPGDELGEYVLESPLGAGSYGSVWKARGKFDRDLLVAIKLFPPETAARRIVREAQALRQVQSPHVPIVVEGDPDAPVPYLVMELVEGESLSDMIARRGRLLEGEVRDLAAQVLQGLAAAHQGGVLHRDIKPENIVVQGSLDHPKGRVVLVDFGLARTAETTGDGIQVSGRQRTAEGIAGTPVYMAPEVLLGGKATVASDRLSQGAIREAAQRSQEAEKKERSVDALVDERVIEKQEKDAVDVSGAAEIEFVPGRESGEGVGADLPAEDDRKKMSLFLRASERGRMWAVFAAPLMPMAPLRSHSSTSSGTPLG